MESTGPGYTATHLRLASLCCLISSLDLVRKATGTLSGKETLVRAGRGNDQQVQTDSWCFDQSLAEGQSWLATARL